MATVNKQTQKELLRFLVAGCSAVLTDFLSYTLLINYFSPSISKGISFFLGTVVAYFLNKFWTFESKKYSTSQLIKFILLYCCTLGVNILVNYAVLKMFSHVLLAFIIATGTSTVLNFVGQKWWVFKSNEL